MEVHHAKCDFEAVDRTDAAHNAFGDAALFTIARELDRIRLLVDPAERVARKNLVPDLGKVAVDQHVDAIVRVHPKVVATFRTHVVIRRKIAAVEDLATRRTLRPERRVARVSVLAAPAQQPIRNCHVQPRPGKSRAA